MVLKILNRRKNILNPDIPLINRFQKSRIVSNILKSKHEKIPAPEFTVINVNEECFFKCQMCFKWKPDINIAPGSKTITTNEIKRFIYDLKKLVPKGHILNFAGGEPFLRKDILELVKYGTDMGFYTQVATNGWLINSKEKAKAIVESGLGGIVISIDGATPKTHDKIRNFPGSFKRAIDAIEKLRFYRDQLQGDRPFLDRLCISIQTVLCELNYHEAIDMVEWVDSTDIRSIHFNAVSEPNNTKHDEYWYRNDFKYLWPKKISDFESVIDKIYLKKSNGSKIAESLPQIKAYKNYFRYPEKFVKNGPCNFDKSLTLSSTGDMFLCFNYGSIGNIRKIRLTEAWRSEQSEDVRKNIRKCGRNCHFLINCYFEE